MIGQIISHYKIIEKLGEGGMGVVYKAHDTKLNRVVALKFLPPTVSASDVDKARFIQEAQAASALNHPNVCTIHDIQEQGSTESLGRGRGPAETQMFIVMEFVSGTTLREKIHGSSGTLPIEEVCAIGAQIAGALSAAHEKGIVHRDIKPENIMITDRQQVKVMDFGLAKIRGSLKLTRTSSTVGTLAYMSPEQIQGGETDHRSDLFSLGVVLFELLTGKLPFRGEHQAALVYSIVHEPAAPVGKLRPDAPEEMTTILERALMKNPEDRYASSEELRRDLLHLKEIVAGGHRSTPPRNPGTKSPSGFFLSVRERGVAVALSFFVVGIALFVYMMFLRRGPQEDARIESIAVLPFRNVSGDPNVEYLTDGMTENIINALSRLQKLRVIPRSTAFHYKGKEDDPQKVGNDLHVRAVLTGRVIVRGDDLNVQAELTDIEKQSQLWGEQYVKKVPDLLVVQDQLSHAIAVQLHLTGDEERTLAKRATENTDAYQLYLKGRYYWDKRSVAGFTRALQYFQQALDIDPNYALAYAGVADCYDLLGLGIYNGLSPDEAYPKAKAAIEKAFALDSSLAEVHTTRAHINHSFVWNWPSIDQEFQRALSLNPNYATAHVFYAVYLSAMGKLDEARTEFVRAQELEPLSLPINTWLGRYYYYRRQYDASIMQFRKAIEIDPSFSNAHLMLGWTFVVKGMTGESLTEFRLAREYSGGNPTMLAALAYARANAGEHAAATALLDTLLAMSRTRFVSPYNIAIAYAGFHDKDNFFTWLQRAVAMHSFVVSVGELQLDPIFDFAREDNRFSEIIRQVGLSR